HPTSSWLTASLGEAVDSAGDDLRRVWSGEPGRVPLLWGMCRALGDWRGRAAGGTQGRDGPVLRPGGLHRLIGVGGSGGREHDARLLLHDGALTDRELLRGGAEVHRGCGGGRVRGAGGARGRPGASRASGPSDRGDGGGAGGGGW